MRLELFYVFLLYFRNINPINSYYLNKINERKKKLILSFYNMSMILNLLMHQTWKRFNYQKKHAQNGTNIIKR